jgi:hypothetical protein
LNTRLSADLNVELYHFWIEGDGFHIENNIRPHVIVHLDDLDAIAWRPEALYTRFAYLDRWLNRQLPLRLTYNLGMTAPVHTARCYLEFLQDVDWRMCVLSLALSSAAGYEGVDQATVLEAVRGSDGFLRAWCESARFTVDTSHESPTSNRMEY